MEELSHGTKLAGCRFSVYPMTDNFVKVIKGALNEVDKTKVWMKTDDISTCIRGRSEDVFDVTKAIFIHAAKTGVHVVFNGTFSIGSPEDIEEDSYLSEDGCRMNEETSLQEKVEVASHFALYPMNTSNYTKIISEQITLAKECGTFTKDVHYASRLDGDANDVFNTLEKIFVNASKINDVSITMTAAISANSPSKKDK